MPTCDFKRRGCTSPATIRLAIEGRDGWSFERDACPAHVGQYRREFENRGYTVEVAASYREAP